MGAMDLPGDETHRTTTFDIRCLLKLLVEDRGGSFSGFFFYYFYFYFYFFLISENFSRNLSCVFDEIVKNLIGISVKAGTPCHLTWQTEIREEHVAPS